MAVQASLRRIGFSIERQSSWRVSNIWTPRRALSDKSGSEVDWMGGKALTRTAMEDAARENRLDFQTAARLLMSQERNQRDKFGWDWHIVQFFIACVPSVVVYGIAMYSRREQRSMQKDVDDRVQRLVQKELHVEVAVELEEVSAIINSMSPDLEALTLRLDAMEDKLTLLEPVLRQPGSPSEKAPAPRQDSNSSHSQQGTDLPKPFIAGSDSGGSLTNEKNR